MDTRPISWLTSTISRECSITINCFLVVLATDLIGAERPTIVANSADVAARIGVADCVEKFST